MSNYNDCCVPNPIKDLTSTWISPEAFRLDWTWTPKPECPAYTRITVRLYRRETDGSITFIDEQSGPAGPNSWVLGPYVTEPGQIYFATLWTRSGCQKCPEVQSPDAEAPAP